MADIARFVVVYRKPLLVDEHLGGAVTLAADVYALSGVINADALKVVELCGEILIGCGYAACAGSFIFVDADVVDADILGP